MSKLVLVTGNTVITKPKYALAELNYQGTHVKMLHEVHIYNKDNGRLTVKMFKGQDLNLHYLKIVEELKENIFK